MKNNFVVSLVFPICAVEMWASYLLEPFSSLKACSIMRKVNLAIFDQKEKRV